MIAFEMTTVQQNLTNFFHNYRHLILINIGEYDTYILLCLKASCRMCSGRTVPGSTSPLMRKYSFSSSVLVPMTGVFVRRTFAGGFH